MSSWCVVVLGFPLVAILGCGVAGCVLAWFSLGGSSCFLWFSSLPLGLLAIFSLDGLVGVILLVFLFSLDLLVCLLVDVVSYVLLFISCYLLHCYLAGLTLLVPFVFLHFFPLLIKYLTIKKAYLVSVNFVKLFA